MAQILKKFIGDNQVADEKIRLDNNSYLRSRNAADNADVNILKVNTQNGVSIGNTEELATTATLEILTGNASGGDSGSIRLETGSATNTRGGIALNAYNITIFDNQIKFQTEAADLYTTSNLKLEGFADAMIDEHFVVGTQDITTSSTPKKNLALLTGSQNDSGASSGTGNLDVVTGFVSAGSGDSGNLIVSTGDISGGVTGNSGQIEAQTGDNSGTGHTGQWTLRTGNAASGNSGNIVFSTGTASGTRGSIALSASAAILQALSSTPMSLRFNDADNSNYLAFKAPLTVSSDVTWTLPAADGTSGQILSTDGAGNLSWVDDSGGITWSTPVNSNIVPDANQSYTLGEPTNGFDIGYIYYLRDPNNANRQISLDGGIGIASDSGILIEETSPSGISLKAYATSFVQVIGDIAPAELRFIDSPGSNHVGFIAPATISSSVIWTLPPSDGTSGQVLSTNGSGVLSWATAAGSSGAAGAVQFSNGSGGFSADATNFSFNDGTDTLSVKNMTVVTTLNGNVGSFSGAVTANSVTIENGLNMRNGAGTQKGQIQGSTTLPDGTPVDLGVFTAGASSTGPLGLYTRNSTVTANTYLETGNASSGTSGSIFIRTGTATSTRGSITMRATSASLEAVSSTPMPLRFNDADNSNYVELKAPATVSTNVSLTLPDTDGNSGEFLQTDGSGVLSWAAATSVTALKETFTLSAGDITNQYIDLTQVAKTDSIHFIVKGGGPTLEGASHDYTVNYTGGAGGKTRITFQNDLASGGATPLAASDVVQVVYLY